MKNLLAFLVFSALTFISCQSESKPTNSTTIPKATASLPSPAPVATASKGDMMDKKGDMMDKKGDMMDKKGDMMDKKDDMMDKKGDMMDKKGDMMDKKGDMMDKKGDMMDKKGDMMDKKGDMMDKKGDMMDKKGDMMDKKGDMTSKVSAEKEKMTAEAAKMKIAEKAKEMKDKMVDKAEIPAKHMEEKVEKIKEMKDEMAFSHQGFDGLLRKHVSSTGKVNYAGFKKDQAKLKGYLKQLEGQSVESGWSKNKKLAYWINAYNAYTVDLIINNYPIKSITDLESGKPWDKKFINLNGKTLSLNDIENVIIRPTFKDARIHFAVNCAAKSCPPLMNKAWTEGNLQSELEKRTKAFVNDSKHNTISGGSAKISKIFEWYSVDFGNLNDYLAKYSKTAVDGSTSISYNEYDWSLNE